MLQCVGRRLVCGALFSFFAGLPEKMIFLSHLFLSFFCDLHSNAIFSVFEIQIYVDPYGGGSFSEGLF